MLAWRVGAWGEVWVGGGHFEGGVLLGRYGLLLVCHRGCALNVVGLVAADIRLEKVLRHGSSAWQCRHEQDMLGQVRRGSTQGLDVGSGEQKMRYQQELQGSGASRLPAALLTRFEDTGGVDKTTSGNPAQAPDLPQVPHNLPQHLASLSTATQPSSPLVAGCGSVPHAGRTLARLGTCDSLSVASRLVHDWLREPEPRWRTKSGSKMAVV